LTILIVDDSQDSRLLIKTFLNKAGFDDVIPLESPFQAFDFLGLENSGEALNVDLILMDVLMPDLNGIEACRRIKAADHLKDIPLIMITAKTEDSTLDEAFNVGAMDYITKPISKVVLLARIRSALVLKGEMDRRKDRETKLLETTRQLEAANAKLKEQSNLDGLTGIANRRRFDEYIDLEWKRACRRGEPLSLVMIDIDHFKAYNDNYGHLAGDDCLKQVAQALRRVVKRPADLVVRYGGEEFAVVLPETHLEGAAALAEELRSAIEDLGIPHAYSPILDKVTVSLGVDTRYPQPSGQLQELVSRADQALYRAKEAGRNRVAIAPVQ